VPRGAPQGSDDQDAYILRVAPLTAQERAACTDASHTHVVRPDQGDGEPVFSDPTCTPLDLPTDLPPGQFMLTVTDTHYADFAAAFAATWEEFVTSITESISES
jgi:hypothetical protein